MSGVPSASRSLWAAAADLADPLGPNGPPSNVQENQYGNGKYYYTWTNYDASYGISISIDGGSSVYQNLVPGTTQWDSGSAVPTDFAVRHYQGGFVTDWVTPAEV